MADRVCIKSVWYRSENKEYYREGYLKNRESRIEKAKLWNKNNPENVRKNADKYRDKNRKQLYDKDRERYYLYKFQAILILGGKCENCDTIDYSKLDIHHKIYTNGRPEQSMIVYKRIIDGAQDEFMLLCETCHQGYHKKIRTEVKLKQKTIDDFVSAS